MNCLIWCQLLQSWCEKWNTIKTTLTPPVTEKHIVVTILEPTHQSQPSPTIHNTYDETLEGLRCCQLLESIHPYSTLVQNVGYLSGNHHHPRLKSQGVALVIYDEFRSQPCKTIHYTYGERMEGLRCCELSDLVPTPSILV